MTEYFISNNGASSLGEEYFLVDSSTGEIFLRKSVLNDDLDTELYTVSKYLSWSVYRQNKQTGRYLSQTEYKQVDLRPRQNTNR